MPVLRDDVHVGRARRDRPDRRSPDRAGRHSGIDSRRNRRGGARGDRDGNESRDGSLQQRRERRGGTLRAASAARRRLPDRRARAGIQHPDGERHGRCGWLADVGPDAGDPAADRIRDGDPSPAGAERGADRGHRHRRRRDPVRPAPGGPGRNATRHSGTVRREPAELQLGGWPAGHHPGADGRVRDTRHPGVSGRHPADHGGRHDAADEPRSRLRRTDGGHPGAQLRALWQRGRRRDQSVDGVPVRPAVRDPARHPVRQLRIQPAAGQGPGDLRSNELPVERQPDPDRWVPPEQCRRGSSGQPGRAPRRLFEHRDTRDVQSLRPAVWRELQHAQRGGRSKRPAERAGVGHHPGVGRVGDPGAGRRHARARVRRRTGVPRHWVGRMAEPLQSHSVPDHRPRPECRRVPLGIGGRPSNWCGADPMDHRVRPVVSAG